MRTIYQSARQRRRRSQAVNRTGFYVGGNAGGAIAHAVGTSNFTDTNLPPGFPFTSNPVTEQPAGQFSRRRASRLGVSYLFH